MSGTTLDVEKLIEPEAMAAHVAQQWQLWNSLRQTWLAQIKETRNYVYASDTSTTTNALNPWRNSTAIPKITQIFDNLKANYMAALFPSSKWLRWQGSDLSSANKQKTDLIQAYMDTKLRQSEFTKTVDRLVTDFIETGNCFASVDYVKDVYQNELGEDIVRYQGPKLYRISPFDIVFDPTASEFSKAPKIVRSLMYLGEVKRLIEQGKRKYQKVFSRITHNRSLVGSALATDKGEGFVADGFSDISAYYASGQVEVLTFYGDIYDQESGKFYPNQIVTIVDRAYVIQQEVNPSWLGLDGLFHAGWRDRPDNLYAQGPLDNLIGMQYRMNHLENLRADVFDQIAAPLMVIKGEVEDFDQRPGARAYVGEDGDIKYLHPDPTALQADFQIQSLENKMEEMAGAPRQAMGIRTPGEKTAFEVQSLDNSSSRIFQNKAQKFEQEFIEPALNAMLAAARQNLDIADVARSIDDATNAPMFTEVTKDDLRANGRLYPVGARHFAERAKRVQELNQLIQAKAMPDVGSHLSGKRLAQLLAEELGEPSLFGDAIQLTENQQLQGAQVDLEAQGMEQLSIKQELGL